MNPKQFISSSLFWIIDSVISAIAKRAPWLGWIAGLPFRILFPVMAYERVSYTAMRAPVFWVVFGIGLSVCFFLQGWLAYRVGHLGWLDLTFGPSIQPDGSSRILFLDDAHNLFNYVLLVPLYLVAGTGFVISLFSMKERMAPLSGDYEFVLDDGIKPLLSGLMAVFLFVVLLILIQAQYAVDIQEKSVHLFWFHGADRTTTFNYNGYAYLTINTFLAGFVILIALLHLELFRWSRILVHGLRKQVKEGNQKASLFLNNGHKLKELFSPFTETAVWSKAFAMLLAINIYTWKASGVSGGSDASIGVNDNSWFLRFVFVLYIAIALWIVSLPRYRVQYEIFKLRKEASVHEYFDIRMPWTIGWSVLIDVLLVAFFSTAIFGTSNIFNLIIGLFDS